mmetsp:Transcript_19903/g.53637  ORF Transcript_19903/g.53637 Transcript_19903/m.53637 type:complete len:188 (-) Transcript_19903:25-588(-)
MAGKSSTLRGMKHGKPLPFQEDERTIQLDISLIMLGAPPAAGEEDQRIQGSGWDFAGQEEYAAGQQQYLVAGALYFMLVPTHKANDTEYNEVFGRWFDVLQARAPGAVVQLVLSHADCLEPSNLEPEAMATAAAAQLEWLRTKVAEHRELTLALAKSRWARRFSRSTCSRRSRASVRPKAARRHCWR